MNVEDYVEWCGLTALYTGNESHYARYRAYANGLSDCGLNIVIVRDFLRANSKGLDVAKWRSYSVYEMTGQATKRIEMTADALAAIGTLAAAEAVRTSKSRSPFDQLMQLDFSNPASVTEVIGNVDLPGLMDAFRSNLTNAFPVQLPNELTESIRRQNAASEETEPNAAAIESLQQIRVLLDQYFIDHAEELQADIDRHGDPRLEAGFTVQGRREELDRLEKLRLIREQQQVDVEKLQSCMDQIRKRLAQGAGHDDLSSLRRKLLERFRENQAFQADENTDEMNEMLERVSAFTAQHAE